LPVRGIFVPLLYQWLNYVCRLICRARPRVGQPLFSESIQPDQPVTITLADGAQRAFEKLQPPVLKETPLPGFYQARQDNRGFWHAINLDDHESDPATMSAHTLAARLIRPDEHPAVAGQSSVTGIFGAPETVSRDAEKQYKLWRLGLWALLILLMGEVWLANRTPR
jgi:hypothetical protein